jgi:UDP-3-O-[3-hydroxymyristoyl] glucosamine N-acyltransferase
MITTALLNKILGLNIQNKANFLELGLSNATKEGCLSFFDDARYANQLNENTFILGVFVTPENLGLISPQKLPIVVDDPRWCYFTLYNYLAKENKVSFTSQIDATAIIHKTAYVAENNVIIGKNTIILPNATILEDVEIGDDCIVAAGTVIGSEGFEYKKTSKGIIPVKHDGKVIIGNNVQIGANTCIDKGFSFRHTIIANEVMIDNLIHIAHGVQIGKGSFIIAGTVLGGSTSIEDDVWVGINASTAPGITLKSKAFVSMGAVVTRSVEEGQQVTGNFAIGHDVFLKNLKRKLKD